MYSGSAQGVVERFINVRYYYYYYLDQDSFLSLWCDDVLLPIEEHTLLITASDIPQARAFSFRCGSETSLHPFRGLFLCYSLVSLSHKFGWFSCGLIQRHSDVHPAAHLYFGLLDICATVQDSFLQM